MADEPVTTRDEELADLRARLALAEALKSERNVSDSRYSRILIEKIVFGTIILFALAALFFIFVKAGLPTPSL
jgi:hypothetical protein